MGTDDDSQSRIDRCVTSYDQSGGITAHTINVNQRTVLDFVERRYAVYQEFRETVTRVTGSGRADSALSFKAAEALERAQFLFGDDVVQYLQRFTNSVCDLECYCAEQAGLQGDDLKRNLEAQRRSKDAIEEFRSTGPALFGRYIRFDQKIT
jgi:hypothetical protein